MTGSISGLLARIKVDEKNYFGMIEQKAVREAASRFLPKHTAAAAWKHRNVSFVEHEGLSREDRGAEQGDVDGALKCSLALGMVAADVRGSFAARQAAGTLPGFGVTYPAEEQKLQTDQVARLPVLMTRGTRCRGTEALRINGTWTTGISCATPSWCCPFCRTSKLPMPESELNGTH